MSSRAANDSANIDDAFCCVCTCEVEPGEASIQCADGKHHIHDGECWEQFLRSLEQSAEKKVCEFWAANQALPCPHGLCKSHIPEGAALSTAQAPLYARTTRQIACAAEREVTAESVRKEMLKESKEARSGAATHITSEIRRLVSACICCPFCKAVFYDFEGCLALTCHRCTREFCGICLKPHGDMRDGHQMVASHQKTFTPQQVSQFQLNLPYFMNATKWPLWREKLQLEAIIVYLKTLRKEVVWESFDHVTQAIRAEKILSEGSIAQLHVAVFAHDVGAFHLIRLPVMFWLLYSAKKSCRFEEAEELTQDQRMSMGKHVVDKIRRRFPSWQPIKNRVPGETFEAINYPPELLTDVAQGVEEWGTNQGLW